MKRVKKQSLPTYDSVGYIELLRRNRSFRQLWLGQVVSQMGDWFDTIALYTIILNLTGSGRDVGLLLVARFVPSFLFGPLSGVVADRFSRQKIMIVTDILRAVVVLGFLFVRRADQLWLIYVLTVFQLAPSIVSVIPSARPIVSFCRSRFRRFPTQMLAIRAAERRYVAASRMNATSVPNQPVMTPPIAAPSVSMIDHVTDEIALAGTSSRSETIDGIAAVW